jgi:excisionase family DNA binding protein
MNHALSAGAAAPLPAVQRLFLSINEACAALGCARSYIYELIGAGAIEARKMGGKTVIPADSLQAYARGLPLAKIAGNGSAQ